MSVVQVVWCFCVDVRLRGHRSGRVWSGWRRVQGQTREKKIWRCDGSEDEMILLLRHVKARGRHGKARGSRSSRARKQGSVR